MSDFAVAWNPATQTGDWFLSGADLAGDDSFVSDVIVSLQTDRVADPDDDIPDGTGNPRGYWGDMPVDPTNAATGAAPDHIGSKLWLRRRAKATEQTRQQIMQDIRDALQWGIDIGAWQAVDVVAWWQPNVVGNLLGIITITRQVSGQTVNQQFDLAWNSTVGATVTVAGSLGTTTAVAPATPAASLPSTPAALTVGAVTSNSILLAWAAIGAAVTYTVQYRVTGSGSVWTEAPGIAGTSVTVTGLASGTGYDFQVAAVNAAGTSAFTATTTGSTVDIAPTGLTAGTPTQTAVPLSWTAPATGAVTGYTVQYRVTGSGSAWTQQSVVGTSVTISGLASGTGYDFQVAAVDAGGTSAFTATVTATTVIATPGVPTALTAGLTTTTTQALTWAAPSSGGAPASYTVQWSPHGANAWTPIAGITGLGVTVTGLTLNTSYDFQVQAVNAGGSSAFTASTTVSTTNYKLTEGFLPGAAQSWTHGSGGHGINVDANCPPSSGAYTAPASVQYAYGASNTVAPSSGWSSSGMSAYNPGNGQTGYPGLYWGGYLSAPATAGAWYLWFRALDAGGNVQTTYCSIYTITAT